MWLRTRAVKERKRKASMRAHGLGRSRDGAGARNEEKKNLFQIPQ